MTCFLVNRIAILGTAADISVVAAAKGYEAERQGSILLRLHRNAIAMRVAVADGGGRRDRSWSAAVAMAGYGATRGATQIIGAFCVYAGILECIQHFSLRGHPAIGDFAASALGALCGGLWCRPPSAASVRKAHR